MGFTESQTRTIAIVAWGGVVAGAFCFYDILAKCVEGLGGGTLKGLFTHISWGKAPRKHIGGLVHAERARYKPVTRGRLCMWALR